MPRTILRHGYDSTISVENLLAAWTEFARGKRNKQDVQEFGRHLMKNVLALHRALADGTYRHGPYEHFKINDPKPRDIHKALVRDRLLHHALYRKLYPFFDRTFIADSYSCRQGKGTHKALDRFQTFGRQVSQNDTRTCWVLKCDVRKFFASIDQPTLISLLAKRIPDERIVALLCLVIKSFHSTAPHKGLPLGNLTSQLLVNVYMNEFDLHPRKVSIETLASGVDFLGWVHFPDYRVLRTSTKRRMLKRLVDYPSDETIASYRGLLSHGNARGLTKHVLSDL